MTTSGEQDVAEDPLKPAMLAIAPALGSGMRITRWSTGRGYWNNGRFMCIARK